MPRALATVMALVLVPALPARAYAPEDTPRREIERSARAMLSQPPARPARAGVVVMRGGRMLYSLNANQPMVPASLMKLATTTAAIARFGDRHRFTTRAMLAGQTLYLVGGGDPTLATEAYREHRFEPKPTDLIKRPAFATPSPTVERLAGLVASAGLRSVGNLVADESLFDAARTQPGWLPSYTRGEPDTGLLSALSVNEGRADLEGDILVPSPPLAAARALRSALAAHGVRVRGSISVGRAPPAAREVARVESPPVGELIDFINRYSINFPSELLLKNLGASFGGAGTTHAGAEVVRKTLGDLGVPLEGFVMADGSGLSVLNRISPRTLASILNVILTTRGPQWDRLRASLPVAGHPGTLQRRMRGAPTRGNLRGKTGQIRLVRGMAGWVTARDGVPLVYVAVFNRARRPFSLTAPLDLFGTLLAVWPRL